MKLLCRYILAFAGDHMKPMNTSITTIYNETIELRCNDTEEVIATEAQTFYWTPEERGLVLGAYYYGYTLFTIPAASVASRYGFKRTYGYSMFVASILTCLFPPLVKLNLYLGIISRAMLGVFHAAGFPSMVGALGIWAPPGERSRLLGITISGLSFGSAIIFFIAGGIIKSFGWESIFYFTGALSMVWVIVWFYLVYDSPEKHPRISSEEKEYILKSLGSNGKRKNLKTPWKSILTSVPVWGIILAHTSFNWGNYTLNQQLPTYFTTILRFDLEMTGLLTSLCFLLQLFVCMFASWITDWIIHKQFLSTICVRKVNTIIATWVTGLCFVFAGYSGCNTALATFLLILISGLNILVTPGCKASIVDIAPAYSGIVFGLSNTIANMPGFVAPQVAGFILRDNTMPEWQTVFWLSAAVQIVGSFLFLFTGTDEIQDWAKTADDKRLQDQKNNLDKDKPNNGANDKENYIPHNITYENQDAESQDKISDKNDFEKDTTKINEDIDIRSIGIIDKDEKPFSENLNDRDSFKKTNDLEANTIVGNEIEALTVTDETKSEEITKNTINADLSVNDNKEIDEEDGEILRKDGNEERCKTIIIADTTSVKATKDIDESLVEIKEINMSTDSLIKDIEKEKVLAITYANNLKNEIDNDVSKHKIIDIVDFSFENRDKCIA